MKIFLPILLLVALLPCANATELLRLDSDAVLVAAGDDGVVTVELTLPGTVTRHCDHAPQPTLAATSL